MCEEKKNKNEGRKKKSNKFLSDSNPDARRGISLPPALFRPYESPAMAKKPVVLIIRDGWGVNPGGKKTAKKDGNAVLLAKTPFHDEVLSKYPRGFLSASGTDVGLPEGQMGNSEVGHLNLGAGRIVYQDLTRITLAIEDGSLAENPRFKKALKLAKGKGKRLRRIEAGG